MRVINGLHRENKGWSWRWEDSLRVTRPLGATTMLDTLLTDGAENQFWYPQLRQWMGPEHLIHIRMYSETGWENPDYGRKWCDLYPEAWARECVRRLSLEHLRYNGLRPIDDPYVIVSFANEQDLQFEGHPGGAYPGHDHPDLSVYKFIWPWSEAVIDSFDAYAPDHRCVFGTNPLAGGHEPAGFPPDYEYQMEEFKRYQKKCAITLLHAYMMPNGTGTNPLDEGYWHGIRMLRPPHYRELVQGYPPVGGIADPGGYHMQYPKRAWAVVEFGNFRHYDTAFNQTTLANYNTEYGYYSDNHCSFVTPFVWNSSDEHKENRIFGNEGLMRGLMELPDYPADDWPPQGNDEEDEMTWVEKYPDQYAEWVAAGGIENNFRKHMIAIDDNYVPTSFDLKFLSDEAAASVAQLNNALYRYPF